jgi:hypothetical protein
MTYFEGFHTYSEITINGKLIIIWVTLALVNASQHITGEWRKLHNEELHIYTLPQILLGRSSQGG